VPGPAFPYTVKKERSSPLKILAINGSPRGETSNTQTILTAFLKGAIAAGAETETVLLAKKEIHPCQGCWACWIKTPGHCVQKDDMAELLNKIWQSDLLIFASPLYVDCVSAQLKTFMDRMLPGMLPHFVKINDVWRHPLRFGTPPKIGVICNSGFPQMEHFQVKVQ
jgi:multimeric flavodoxin WrbA